MSDLALITGASKGIGRATAISLAGEELEILATGRNVTELESLKDEINRMGGICRIVPAELNSDAGLEKLVTAISNSGKSLKLLVHSAGVAITGTVQEMKKNDWQQVIDTNLSVPFYMTQKCLPLMGKGSRIIFINSVAGKQTFPEWAAYCASKHGLRAMADALRTEVSTQGILVTTIFPASVDTPMQAALPYDWDTAKMLQPQQVADAVRYCLHQPNGVSVNDIELQNPAGIF